MKLSHIGGVIAAANPEDIQPLLQVGAIPIIRRIVITYQQAGVFPVVVVTSGDDEEIRRELAPYGVIFLKNTDEERAELMDAARIGLQYLRGKCDRVVLTPVNVPMFTPATLRALTETPGDVVAPSFGGKGGHPVVIAEAMIPAIVEYRGDKGLRGALAACTPERVWVEVEDPGILANAHHREELYARLHEHNSAILNAALHIRLEQEEAFFSARLKLLLYLIADTNNMRTACACSGIAHSKAWDMINRLEQNLGYRVVERQRGGRSGGSTRLTDQGEAFLAAYHDFERTVCQFAQNEFQKRFISTKIIE